MRKITAGQNIIFYHRRAAGQSSMGTGQLLKEDLWKYGKVMDERDETKGMNNLCGAVEAMLADRPKSTGQKKCSSITWALSIIITYGKLVYKVVILLQNRVQTSELTLLKCFKIKKNLVTMKEEEVLPLMSVRNKSGVHYGCAYDCSFDSRFIDTF